MKKFMKYKYEAAEFKNSLDYGHNLELEYTFQINECSTSDPRLGRARPEATDETIEIEVPPASTVKQEIDNNTSEAEVKSGRTIKQDSNNNLLEVEVPPADALKQEINNNRIEEDSPRHAVRQENNNDTLWIEVFPRPYSDLDAKPELKEERENVLHTNERPLLHSDSGNLVFKKDISEDQQDINYNLEQQNYHVKQIYDIPSAFSLLEDYSYHFEYKTENGDVKPENEEHRQSVITPNLTLSTISSELIDYINNFTVAEEDEELEHKSFSEEVKDNEEVKENDALQINNKDYKKPIMKMKTNTDTRPHENIIVIKESDEAKSSTTKINNKMHHRTDMVNIKTEAQLVYVDAKGESKKFKNLVPPTYCRDFIRGSCKRGASCIFKHNVIFTQCKKLIVSRLCRDFMNGKCQRADCLYAHATHFEKEKFLRTGELAPHVITHLKYILNIGWKPKCNSETEIHIHKPLPVKKPHSHSPPNLYPNPVALDRILNENTLSHVRLSAPVPTGLMLRIPPVISYPPPSLPQREPIAPETLLPTQPQPAQSPPPSSSGNAYMPPQPLVAQPRNLVPPTAHRLMAHPEPVTLSQQQRFAGPRMKKRMQPERPYPPQPLPPMMQQPRPMMPLNSILPPPPPPPLQEPASQCPPGRSFADGRPPVPFQSPPMGPPFEKLPSWKSQQTPRKRQRCEETMSTKEAQGPAPKKDCQVTNWRSRPRVRLYFKNLRKISTLEGKT